MMPGGQKNNDDDDDSINMDEINNNKSIQRREHMNIRDVPVEILSVPTKKKDGNAILQCEASPTPASTAQLTGYGDYYQNVGVSPMPPTPNLATTAVSVSGLSHQTPSSQSSKDTLTLAALYHSSRRSRHESPSPLPATLIMGAHTTSLSSRPGFPPPPPLTSPSPQVSKATISNKGQAAHTARATAGFQQMGNASSSSIFHDSWNTSMSSLSRSFIQAPPLYNPTPSVNAQETHTSQGATAALAPPAASSDQSYLTPVVPPKPKLAMPSYEYTPNATMDRQLLDLANESSTNMLMEQLSNFSTRSRSEFEDRGGSFGVNFPPTKKQKGGNSSSDNDQTPGSCRSPASFDIQAHPSPDISPLDNGVGESIQCLLALSNAGPSKETQQRHPREGEEPEHDQEAARRKREQDIIRRKVQRLLLIRHATLCSVPLPPPGCDEDSRYICTVTSHCAEGKRLSEHIRHCKDTNCRYTRCLTTRDVLGHYRSCRDRRCEVCGPVRAMHVRDKKAESQKDGKRGESESSRHERKESVNSLETIDTAYGAPF
jgi:hypothetical protein